MDAISSYIIKKKNLFINDSFSMKSEYFYDNACWLLFGKNISSNQLDKINLAFPHLAITPLMAWTVGPYDVLFISGVLTDEQITLCHQLSLDCASFDAIPRLDKSGLALFDMDSTAITIECIDEIAKLSGVGRQVSLVTEQAMRGELDFTQSLQQRVALLKGTSVDILNQVKMKLPYSPGMRALTASLQSYGWKVAIASGGFNWFSDKIKQELCLDFAQSNQLVVEKGRLTGQLSGVIVDAQRKADILQQLAEQYDIALSNTLAVGDGANDIPMIKLARLGVAYRAKPSVQQAAKASIVHADLGGVMCILSASLIAQSFKR